MVCKLMLFIEEPKGSHGRGPTELQASQARSVGRFMKLQQTESTCGQEVFSIEFFVRVCHSHVIQGQASFVAFRFPSFQQALTLAHYGGGFVEEQMFLLALLLALALLRSHFCLSLVLGPALSTRIAPTWTCGVVRGGRVQRHDQAQQPDLPRGPRQTRARRGAWAASWHLLALPVRS